MYALKNVVENNHDEDRLNELKEYIKSVHAADDGYITLAITNKGKWQQYHFKKEDLEENLNKILSLETNTYGSVNSFYKPVRGIQNIRKINSIYLEYDRHNGPIPTNLDIQSLLYFLDKDVFNSVPQPNLIINSGRGIHLYWLLENLPYQAIPLWTIVRDKMVDELKKIDVKGFKLDTNSMDLARVYRLPGTINTKTNTLCETIYKDNGRYRLDEIIQGYYPELQIIEKTKNKPKTKLDKKQRQVVSMYNVYNLHYTRLVDIVKLVELREGKVEGNRELICFLYRYYSCLYKKDPQEALLDTLELNKKFAKPLLGEEVKKATVSAEKAYNEWLETVDLIGKYPIFNADKEGRRQFYIKGYNYRNSTLIKLLNITPEEQKHMQTIISREEKYARNNNRRTPKNKEGLTKKQQELADLKVKILEFKEQGLSLRKIADELKVSLGKVQRCLNK